MYFNAKVVIFSFLLHFDASGYFEIFICILMHLYVFVNARSRCFIISISVQENIS